MYYPSAYFLSLVIFFSCDSTDLDVCSVYLIDSEKIPWFNLSPRDSMDYVYICRENMFDLTKSCQYYSNIKSGGLTGSLEDLQMVMHVCFWCKNDARMFWDYATATMRAPNTSPIKLHSFIFFNLLIATSTIIIKRMCGSHYWFHFKFFGKIKKVLITWSIKIRNFIIYICTWKSQI